MPSRNDLEDNTFILYYGFRESQSATLGKASPWELMGLLIQQWPRTRESRPELGAG